MQKIALLSTGHPPKDERIFYKFARSLSTAGLEVTIVTSTSDLQTKEDQITFDCFLKPGIKSANKLKKLNSTLAKYDPDVIIVSEPFALFTAFVFKLKSPKSVKIISDVTEWYPENVALKKQGIKKLMTYILLFLFNILASNLANGFIIGELSKKKRYDFIAPLKVKKIISYFPVKSFFHCSPPPFSGKLFTICFTGLLTEDRGFLRLLEITRQLKNRNPETGIHLMLIGKFLNDNMKAEYIKVKDELNISLVDWVPYERLSEVLSKADICIDLRNTGFIYNNSLPIKIFEYLASGKPVIYSGIKSLIPLFSECEFGFLVDPMNDNEILNSIENYIHNPELLQIHSKNGYALIDEKYNWGKEEKELISFIQKFLKP